MAFWYNIYNITNEESLTMQSIQEQTSEDLELKFDLKTIVKPPAEYFLS